MYDGANIIAQTPALGYILGDEGSGAVLGRNFLNGILKGWLPIELRNLFMSEWQLNVSDIIEKVYREPSPNRFMASITRFIASNMDNYPQLADMVVRNFETFIDVNIQPYLKERTRENVDENAKKIAINAVGSIAFYFNHQLECAANNRGLDAGSRLHSYRGHGNRGSVVGLQTLKGYAAAFWLIALYAAAVFIAAQNSPYLW